MDTQTSWTLILVVRCPAFSMPTWATTCLDVSSSHQAYAWHDGIERGMTAVLHDTCTPHKAGKVSNA